MLCSKHARGVRTMHTQAVRLHWVDDCMRWRVNSWPVSVDSASDNREDIAEIFSKLVFNWNINKAAFMGSAFQIYLFLAWEELYRVCVLSTDYMPGCQWVFTLSLLFYTCENWVWKEVLHLWAWQRFFPHTAFSALKIIATAQGLKQGRIKSWFISLSNCCYWWEKGEDFAE